MSIYLDNAATTKIAPEAFEAMLPYLQDDYGNPSSAYELGRNARDAIEVARVRMARLFNCRTHNIIFTSGGSESNSMVFKGLKDRLTKTGKTHIITTSIEHSSVLRAAESLSNEGFAVTYVNPGANGKIVINELRREIREDTGLISVMHINNETGAVNDIAKIGVLCDEMGILFHSDCVQSAGSLRIDTKVLNGLDFASISAHKIHGAKGVGALFIREPEILSPLIEGGGTQEFGLRGGTENVAGIVAFGVAAELVNQGYKRGLKQKFLARLERAFGGSLGSAQIHINGGSEHDPGMIVNLFIGGVSGETLMFMLDSQGVCVSTGSACNSHELKPSHVLTAIGMSDERARSSIRVSFSRYTTVEEVENAADIMAGCIKTLRQY